MGRNGPDLYMITKIFFENSFFQVFRGKKR